MYIQRVDLKNVRLFKKLTLTFDPNAYAGWHVIVGENASGKTTLLRAIALALCGVSELRALREVDITTWVNSEAQKAEITLYIQPDRDYDELDPLIRKQVDLDNGLIPYQIRWQSDVPLAFSSVGVNDKGLDVNELLTFKTLWGLNTKGWFSSAFGPLRRFDGGDKDLSQLYDSNPKLAAHLSAFTGRIAFTAAVDWLKDLDHESLKDDEISKYTLDSLKKLINEGFLLPNGSRIDKINSKGVFLRSKDKEIALSELSDGYLSTLSLTLELLRQLARVYGAESVFKEVATAKNHEAMKVTVPGVVLIDEIDAHLHPTWQVRIGKWFTHFFPNIQFIVTTHSPLICQSAHPGSIWQLTTLEQNASIRKVIGPDYERLVYGSVLDAYSTEVFGSQVIRSSESQEMLEELAALNMKALKSTLTKTESKRRQELRERFPDSVSVLDF